MKRSNQWWMGLAALSFLGGCAEGPAGMASFSAVSTKIIDSKRVEVVAELDVKMCNHNAVLLFVWGDIPNHEYLLRTALDEHDADALTNARLDFTSVPLILYNQSCARLRGDLVRLDLGADDGRAVASPTAGRSTSDEQGGEQTGVAP